MKKILFLSPLPPPYYGSAMSSQMCLEILQKSKDFEVRNIKLNYSKEMEDIGKVNLNKVKGFFYVKKQIKEKIKNFNPDLVYFVPATSYQGLIRDFLFIREIKKYWGGKILFHIRSRILENDWNNKFKRKIIIKMFENQKAIILGEELKNDLHGLINEKNIFILPNAIKNEISDFELKKIIAKRRKNKQLNILFLSNMDRTKGWLKTLGVCKILNNKKFNFKCDFVGGWLEKKDEDYFKNFVKKNKLEKRVFAHGKKIGDEKRKFLEKTNVLVFPTEFKMETFGRVILEGYMFGIPVIANGIATIPSTIQDKKTGFVLRKNTGREISLKILNETNWEQMGIEGRKMFLKGYEIKNYSKKFIGILNKV